MWAYLASGIVQNQLPSYIQEAENAVNTIQDLILYAKNWKTCLRCDVIRSSSGSLCGSLCEHLI